MGTAAAGNGQERPGDGESPGARPADQITPGAAGRTAPAPAAPGREQLTRTGRQLIERAANRPAGQIAVKEGGTAGPPLAVSRPSSDPSTSQPIRQCHDRWRSPMPPSGAHDVAYFPSVPAAIDLPAMEHEILARWQDGKFFERSLERTAGGPRWTFYEGPPTANGMPGVHHIEARVFKDVFPRFKTMQGFHVPRQGGWDCHGLPVEVAVERELGLSGKKDIEAYGVAEFNARCRESVLRHVDAFEELTDRLGYWIDLSRAYRTMDASYVESVWWSLKEIFRKGLLVKDYRISPYCPRCETALSDHEMGQPDVYRTVTDPAVTVRFPLLTVPAGATPLLAGADLLVWTTTPWTLVSNTAVAVHPDESYVVARRAGSQDAVVVAEQLMPRVLGEG